MKSRLQTANLRRRHRRGLATLWLVASGGVLALLLIFLTDTARLYLARIELQNALDASALSAVKTWRQYPVSPDANAAARMEAKIAYLANFPSTATPSKFALDPNGNQYAGNGNERCPPLHSCPDGLVLLGSIQCPAHVASQTLTLNADVVPDRARIIVEAANTADTFAAPSLFSVRVEGSPPADVESVTINLASVGSGGAHFDPGGGAESDGYGPFPIAPLCSIAGYSLSDDSPSSAELTVLFDGGLSSGASASFGIDTDLQTRPMAPMSSAQLHGASVLIRLSNGAAYQSFLVSDDGLRVIAETVLGEHECAVQVQGCVEVTSIAPSFLGMLFGPYRIQSRSTAWLRCVGDSPEPELVRVEGVICGGFAMP